MAAADRILAKEAKVFSILSLCKGLPSTGIAAIFSGRSI